MGFKSISIRNFRAIRELELNNSKQINLITGRNNCGKSTFLEALFLSVGVSNPQLAVNIHNFRNLLLTDDEDFSFMFTNMSEDNLPVIKSSINKKWRTLKIIPLFEDAHIPFDEKKQTKLKNNINQDLSADASSISAESNEIIGLKFNFSIENKAYSTQFSINRGQLRLNKEYIENIHGSYLTPSTIMTNLQNRLDTLIVNKSIEKIVFPLREIEPNLNDITMGANGNIYADIGIEKLIPINIMGDGIRRILAILAYIYEKKHSIILIDEIENGLHYSSLDVLWKAIKLAASDNDVQIFATTHSFDCVKAFSNVFNPEESAALLKLERTKDTHNIKELDIKSLEIALERDFEVR